MKNHKGLLAKYDTQHTVFIDHEWGQSPTALYNLVSKAWSNTQVGDKIVITSYKNFGLKSCLDFLNEQGISCLVTGKGAKGLRLVECQKDSDRVLPKIQSSHPLQFRYRKKTYKVNPREAVFSKKSLDPGTKFLLDVIFDRKVDLNSKEVADFGAGWGAISLVLANEFPDIKLVAFEKDDSAFEAAQANLKNHSATSIVKADLTQLDSAVFTKYKGKLDYVISNPPFHASQEDKELIFENAHGLLKKKGNLLFVTEKSFESSLKKTAQAFFRVTSGVENDSYTVFVCHKK